MKTQKKDAAKVKIKDLPAGKKGKTVKGGASNSFLKLDGIKGESVGK